MFRSIVKVAAMGLALASAVGSSAAQAQSPGIEANLRFPVTVYGGGAGAWFNPAEPGTGIYFSGVRAVPNAPALFAGAYFGYDVDGRPLWLTGAASAPQITPTSISQLGASSVASWQAPMSEGSNGPCPTCAYRAPTLSDSPWGTLEARFVTPYSVKLSLNGASVGQMVPADFAFGGDVYAWLLGTWNAVSYGSAGQSEASVCDNVLIEPGDNPAPRGYWEGSAGVPGYRVPSSGGRWLKMVQTGQCLVMSSSNRIFVADNNIAVAVNPSSNEVIRETVGLSPVDVGIRVVPAGQFYDIVLVDRNTVVMWLRQNGDISRVTREIRLTRRNPL